MFVIQLWKWYRCDKDDNNQNEEDGGEYAVHFYLYVAAVINWLFG